MKKKSNSRIERRSFIKKSLQAGALIPFLGSGLLNSSCNEDSQKNNGKKKSLNILILGGTSFLGPHQIAYALGRGHKITTFTRGKTKPRVYTELFDKVEALIGDREDNLEALKGRKWDAVIDNSGNKTHWTEATAKLLKENVDHYVYTSSVSVHYPYNKAGASEGDSVVLEMPEKFEDEDERYTYEYGIMKATSELAVIKELGEAKSLIIRPHFMFGPADKTDRFMYWPLRMATGGNLIVPGKPDDPVQFIDVRDQAEFMIRMIEEGASGTFNCAGPAQTTTMSDFVDQGQKTFNKELNIVQIDDNEFLKSQSLIFLAPWIMDMKNYHGMSRVNNQKAIAAGLTFRTIGQTLKDTHEWWYSDAVEKKRREGFVRNSFLSQEKGIIELWETYNKAQAK